MARSDEIASVLEEMSWGSDVIVQLKDGTDLAGIYEGIRDDQILLADGTETTYPAEIPLSRVKDVLLELSTHGPE